LKQTKLRKRRVIRYAILYFVILVVFVALIAGPIVAGKYLKFDVKLLSDMELVQPTGYNNNDTGTSVTGSCLGDCPAGPGGDAAATAVATDAAKMMARFMAF
jgi:1,3-beta-glucan synthase